MDVVDKVTPKVRKGVTGWAATGQVACVRGRKEGLSTVTSQQILVLRSRSAWVWGKLGDRKPSSGEQGTIVLVPQKCWAQIKGLLNTFLTLRARSTAI